jgi:hypothetical protein
MEQGIALSRQGESATLLAAVLLAGGPDPRETASVLSSSAFWTRNISLQNIASANIPGRPRFCSSTHAPNDTCTCSHHR